MARAFLTGGSGFIGGHLIKRLVAEGWSVRALARSESSAAKVRERGAEPVMGDLDDVDSMRGGAQGCKYAFHAAATLGEWGRRDDYVRGNVTGTENALKACRDARVRRFVHVGTEAALLDGQPLVNADETVPLRPDSRAHYSATKAIAERTVLDANGVGFETVVVRPRLVWGPGDTTILPALVDAVRSGRFAWIGRGNHLTSTTHVANVVEGLGLAATRGRPGQAYFVTDGDPVVFRSFVNDLLRTAGVDPPTRNVPLGVARPAAAVCEGVWGALRRKSPPPLTRLAVWLSALECTIDISKARRELAYEPVKTIAEGMAELRAA
ncbi:MAG TPA: NAD-dependent epimerase/dehydratase family protein [Thermoleophilaceae bacterium]|nr:NAD-dependent epimerase/dehydratase family protein [Thermoleophilaceae bacterium]